MFSSRPDKPHDWELIAANRVTDERVTPLRLLALVTAISSSACCFLALFGMIESKGVSVNDSDVASTASALQLWLASE